MLRPAVLPVVAGTGPPKLKEALEPDAEDAPNSDGLLAAQNRDGDVAAPKAGVEPGPERGEVAALGLDKPAVADHSTQDSNTCSPLILTPSHMFGCLCWQHHAHAMHEHTHTQQADTYTAYTFLTACSNTNPVLALTSRC